MEKKFYQKLTTKLDHDIHVTGRLQIVGTRYIPTKASIYIEVMQLKTKSGQTTKLYSGSEPKVADEAGKVNGKAEGELNLI